MIIVITITIIMIIMTWNNHQINGQVKDVRVPAQLMRAMTEIVIMMINSWGWSSSHLSSSSSSSLWSSPSLPGEGCEGSSPVDESDGSRGRGSQERSGKGDHLDHDGLDADEDDDDNNNDDDDVDDEDSEKCLGQGDGDEADNDDLDADEDDDGDDGNWTCVILFNIKRWT